MLSPRQELVLRLVVERHLDDGSPVGSQALAEDLAWGPSTIRSELAGLDDAAFRALFSGSPIKRIGRDRFVRNVLYAIGNSADPALADVATARLNDADFAVRDAAEWALSRLQELASSDS